MQSLRIVTGSTLVVMLSGCGAGLVPHSAPPSYKGLVATRSYTNDVANNGTLYTWVMNRSFHIARDTIAKGTLQVVWGNYLASLNGESSSGPATYKASIEYPEGVVSPCTFGNASSITVMAQADATTDPCGPAIPEGATFWVRMLYVNPAGIDLITSPGTADLTREQFAFGTGTPVDAVNGGSITTTGDGPWLFPIALVAPTANVSVCILGDSRSAGLRDVVSDASGDIGEIERSIGPSYAYTNLAVIGEQAANALTQIANRSRMLTYCSHVIDEYGINDMALGGATATQVATSRAALAKLTGKVTFGTTIPPLTTSTDDWATVVNQTTSLSTEALNTLVKSGIAGESGYFDVDRGLDPMDLQKFPAATTPDGVHENATGNALIRDSGVINPSLLHR